MCRWFTLWYSSMASGKIPHLLRCFCPIQLPLEISPGHVSFPNGICSYYSRNSSALHWFTRGYTNPYQPVPTPEKMQQSENQWNPTDFLCLQLPAQNSSYIPKGNQRKLWFYLLEGNASVCVSLPMPRSAPVMTTRPSVKLAPRNSSRVKLQ